MPMFFALLVVLSRFLRATKPIAHIDVFATAYPDTTSVFVERGKPLKKVSPVHVPVWVTCTESFFSWNSRLRTVTAVLICCSRWSSPSQDEYDIRFYFYAPEKEKPFSFLFELPFR